MKSIPNFPDYFIDSRGNVFSFKHKNPKVLKLNYCFNDYLKVRLFKNGKPTTKNHHRLFADAFLSNPNGYPQINHKNGNKHDNRLENLEWCTSLENNIHALNSNLRKIRGEDNPRSKLTWKDVHQIRNEIKLESARVLGKKYGVSKTVILNIKNKKAWKE